MKVERELFLLFSELNKDKCSVDKCRMLVKENALSSYYLLFVHDCVLLSVSKSPFFVTGLGPGQEKQSPTMEGWNRLMNNIPSSAQNNSGQYSQNQFQNQQQQQNSNNRMMQQQQGNHMQQQQPFSNQPSMGGPGNGWQQTMSMVRTNNMQQQPYYGAQLQPDNSYNQQPLTYPSNFPNQQQGYQQQPMDPMQQQVQQQAGQLQPQQQPLVVQQPPPAPLIQQSLPQSQSVLQSGQYPGQPAGSVQYIQQPGQQAVAGPQLVVQAGQPGQVLAAAGQPTAQATLVNPNQQFVAYHQTAQQSQPSSYVQPGPSQGGLVTGPAQPLVISATPAPSYAQAPQPVQLVAQSLPTVLPSHTMMDPSLMAPTPALISAPTPAPILVNNTALPVQQHPVASSSNTYSFDPSGLTPAQQLAYAQAQQQHQQQHLKKMRQRLPHVSGRELNGLHKQIKDLQHRQHLQTLQTLRIAQVQEKQAFNYLDSAFKTRQKPNTYHRVNFQLKV